MSAPGLCSGAGDAPDPPFSKPARGTPRRLVRGYYFAGYHSTTLSMSLGDEERRGALTGIALRDGVLPDGDVVARISPPSTPSFRPTAP